METQDPLQFLLNQKQTIINGLADLPIELLKATLAIGFLTMIIIEMSKVTQRAKFHESMLAVWLRSTEIDHRWGIRLLRRLYYGYDAPPRYELKSEAMDDLVLHSTAGNKKALFSLSVENLCGQIGLAIQTMLESPEKHRTVLERLLGGCLESKDVKDEFELLVMGNTDGKESDPNYNVVKSKLAAYIQRNIDSLQINICFGWKNVMRHKAMLISYLISFVVIFLFTKNYDNWPALVVFIFMAGYVGGFMASVFRDILSVLESYKK